ncbi:aminoglycoside phosphotransferase family protein [Chloroflexi bacterium TSY]|nr:aminoglycoside phosphotransferase family protein [Chloroflexi bacterium TSY]
MKHPSDELQPSSQLPRFSKEQGIEMTDGQIQLLREACREYEAVHVEKEFGIGKSGAKSYLIQCAGRPHEVAKFDHPHYLRPEFEAYRDYVEMIPQMYRVELRGGLYTNPNKTLGLIIYNYLGRRRSDSDDSDLLKYYQQKNGENTANTLEVLFKNYEKWREAPQAKRSLLAYDQEYDRLLPVRFILSRVWDSSNIPDNPVVLQSGAIQWTEIDKLEVGQIVELRDFDVTDNREEVLRLSGLSPEEENSTYLRIKLDKLSLDQYPPGTTLESAHAKITATRKELLRSHALESNIRFTHDKDESEFILDGKRHPNPLHYVDPVLKENRKEVQYSVIHGDLNLRNIMVDPETGASWLIDFADMREGPTLLDFQRLEEHVIAEMLAPAMQEAGMGANYLVEIFNVLHTNTESLQTRLRLQFVRLRYRKIWESFIILSRSKFGVFGYFQSRLQGFWSHLFRFRLQKTTYFISENRPNLTQKLDIDWQICIYVNCLARILSQNLKFGSTDTEKNSRVS